MRPMPTASPGYDQPRHADQTYDAGRRAQQLHRSCRRHRPGRRHLRRVRGLNSAPAGRKSVQLSITLSDDEDSGASSGWSIADGRWARLVGDTTWRAQPESLKMAIRGGPKGSGTPDMTPTARKLVGNVVASASFGDNTSRDIHFAIHHRHPILQPDPRGYHSRHPGHSADHVRAGAVVDRVGRRQAGDLHPAGRPCRGAEHIHPDDPRAPQRKHHLRPGLGPGRGFQHLQTRQGRELPRGLGRTDGLEHHQRLIAQGPQQHGRLRKS